jgi:hypothetical protein
MVGGGLFGNGAVEFEASTLNRPRMEGRGVRLEGKERRPVWNVAAYQTVCTVDIGRPGHRRDWNS